jgi:hypothetical protein
VGFVGIYYQWYLQLIVYLSNHTNRTPVDLGHTTCEYVFRTRIPKICKLQKRCTRLAAASDKVYQLLAHGRWFSPGTPASSTTKTGRHDIAEILLKVALKHQK